MAPTDTLLRACDAPVCFQSPAMLRSACRLAVCAAVMMAAFRSHAADPLPATYERVTVAPAKTSIYLGTVSMTMPTFVRVNGGYEAN